MEKFSQLLEDIIFSPSTNKKTDLLEKYFKEINMSEKGSALEILSSNHNLKSLRISDLKNLIYSRLDKTLFELSYDYVGDLAETISLIWRSKKNSKIKKLPLLSEFLCYCREKPKDDVYNYTISLLDIYAAKIRTITDLNVARVDIIKWQKAPHFPWAGAKSCPSSRAVVSRRKAGKSTTEQQGRT